ncbi:ABC transporter permease [Ornithobacterium rhinotracheale]|uniref:ABC transporter permease n=1 Tax=Ornithobacterium rhinotracheale TaxID=28251 RepID=UPI00129C90DA|nr:ABC transporter permease [Ornithobacterium rhinotracheale]MRJ07961.1 ABC transporter permease [Ornithobacterium rhinotracheale]UOH78528.1 ABC transporter permease [Ornithobacterium rhinotracheale]
MKQIWLVTKREFLVEVRKKSFIILTIAMPFLIVLFGLVIGFLNMANNETNRIAVIDESGLFERTFESNEHNQYTFYAPKEFNGLKDSILISKSLTGILFIPRTDSTFTNLKNGIEFISNKNIGVSLIPTIEKKIEKTLTEINLKRKGITTQDLDEAEASVKIAVTQESDDGSKSTDQMQEGVKSIFSGILMYATFMFIMMYGVRVMRSVIEEKNNRVVEIIISSVKPFNLMMGKILGSTLVAITQFAIWIVLILAFLMISPALIDSFFAPAQQLGDMATTTKVGDFSEIKEIIHTILNMNIPLIVSVFFIYFFFGYLFYSSLFAAIGASVESDTETQQFMWLGILPLMLGLYGSISIFENPDGPVGYWFSIIPFTSPVTMMARISFGVPTEQLFLSIGLLIGSVFLMVWFAAKIYRVGILMYGKKPSIKEWLKWLKY